MTARDTDFSLMYEAFGGRSPGGLYATRYCRRMLLIRRRDAMFHPDPDGVVTELNARVLPSGVILALVDEFRSSAGNN
jgi:hypothetical protein